MELWEAGAGDLAALYARGAASPRETVAALLGRIARHDGDLGCFLTVMATEAAAAAAESERRWQAGTPRSAIDGVPVALKDNLCVRGQAATAGSRVLEGYIPPYDADVVERLQQAGAVVLGKTNMDEFAMGSSSEHSAFFPVRNPWDRTRVPGGSSGGSAAAVAAGLTTLALGSDTGGSVRQPAAFTGVLGMRPTYGLVSRFGLIAFASSLDQVGPFARSVADLAALLEVIAQHDRRDATSAPGPRPAYRGAGTAGVDGLALGVPREYFAAGIAAEVEAAVRRVLGRLEERGARAEELSLPHTTHGISSYYLVANAEASSNLARFDGVRYGRRRLAGDLAGMYERTRGKGFGREVKRRIMLGTYVLRAGYSEAYYRRALEVRALIRDDFRRAFTRADLLITPVAPTPAFALGEKVEDPLTMYLSDVFTVGASLAGIPGLAVPCGFSRQGLPLSLQLLGRPGDERRLLQVGAAIEQDFALRPAVARL